MEPAPDPHARPRVDADLATLRRDYQRGGLAEDDAGADPLVLFRRWFAEARAAEVLEPNAMVLATVGADGRPSARAVLLKGVDEDGFTFFTNHASRKGGELAENPHCALTFVWLELQRQVRVEGVAQRLGEEASSAYFASRPRDSQLGAWASPQSTVVPDREDLEGRYAAVAQRYAEATVPCPPFWGGYLVSPEQIEFWQGRHGRMHDRLSYLREPSGWLRQRLAP